MMEGGDAGRVLTDFFFESIPKSARVGRRGEACKEFLQRAQE